jgi:hypothetical protein
VSPNPKPSTPAGQVLAPEVLLALCLLGCWFLREAVMEADVVRWALMGWLPYLALAQHSLALLANGPLRLPLKLVQPGGTRLPSWRRGRCCAAQDS